MKFWGLFLTLLACSCQEPSTSSEEAEEPTKETSKPDEDQEKGERYIYAEKFPEAWNKGEVDGWVDSGEDFDARAKTAFHYFDLNVKLVGVGFWSMLPKVEGKEPEVPRVGSETHTKLVQLRDWAYSAGGYQKALDVLREVDRLIKADGELGADLEGKLWNEYLESFEGT